MTEKKFVLAITLICCAIAAFADAEEVVVNQKMKAALEKFNPRFAAWETADYSQTVQKGASEDARQPFALVLDVNEDQISDLVLDGHDEKNSLLICLLSIPEGYDVIVIRQSDLFNPKEIANLNDGVKEMGLNYYLWPNKKKTGFILGYPQQSDSEGHLLNDGAMIDYIFKDGEFQESYQTL